MVAATVILRKNYSYNELDDSKKISEKKRNILSSKIISESIAWSISLSDVNEIDNLNNFTHGLEIILAQKISILS